MDHFLKIGPMCGLVHWRFGPDYNIYILQALFFFTLYFFKYFVSMESKQFRTKITF